MNWEIAFFIWLKGLALFAVACMLVWSYDRFRGNDFLVLCEGLLMVTVAMIGMVVVASIITCPAILLYAVSLNLTRRANMGYKRGIIFLIIAASIAVGIMDFILYLFGVNLKDVFSYLFWIPLLLCMVSILISRKKIALYLQPTVATQLSIME